MCIFSRFDITDCMLYTVDHISSEAGSAVTALMVSSEFRSWSCIYPKYVFFLDFWDIPH